MAPNGEAVPRSFPRNRKLSKPPTPSSNSPLQRTTSNISLEFCQKRAEKTEKHQPRCRVEDAKCECCSMNEESTREFIDRVRKKFFGKWICRLCAEAVKEQAEKNGIHGEEALSAHTKACVKFNKLSRVCPVLFQAEAMREILKKSRIRAMSMGPTRDEGCQKKRRIVRSSSCISAITREINDLRVAKRDDSESKNGSAWSKSASKVQKSKQSKNKSPKHEGIQALVCKSLDK